MTVKAGEIYHQTVNPELTSSLRANFRNPMLAIRELADNIFDARIPGRPVVVRIATDKDMLVVTGENEKGMDATEFPTWLDWGNRHKSRDEHSLGGFGYGAKAACHYLARSLIMRFSRFGGNEMYILEDPEWGVNAGRKEVGYTLRNTAAKTYGGFFEYELTKLNVRVDPARLTSFLANTYRLALVAKEMVISVNSHEVEPLTIPLDGEPSKIEFKLSNGTPVTGWAGKLSQKDLLPSEVRTGVRVCMNSRLILDGVTWGIKNPGMNFISAELNVNGRIQLTSDKSAIDELSADWIEMGLLFEEKASELLKVLDSESHPDKKMGREKAQLERAFRMFRRAMIKIPEILTFGIAPPKRHDIISQTPVRKNVRTNSPATTAPNEAVGRRERMPAGSFTDFFPRNLGPSRQSDIETVDGKISLIIGTGHSMYKEMAMRELLWLHAIQLAARELAIIKLSGEIGSKDAKKKEIDPDQLRALTDSFCRNILENGKD